VGLERGPLSLVSTTEGLLLRKCSREYGRRNPSILPRGTLSASLALTSPTSGGRSVGIVRSSEVICMSDPEKLALTLSTSGGRLVGIVRSRTQATELVLAE
jgi:hypothetical protein